MDCAKTVSKLVGDTGFLGVLRNQIFEDSDSNASIANDSYLEITSGPARTHSMLLDTTAVHGPRLTHKDTFLCKDAVDLCKLLYLSRRTLYIVGKENGGNVLLDEQ